MTTERRKNVFLGMTTTEVASVLILIFGAGGTWATVRSDVTSLKDKHDKDIAKIEKRIEETETRIVRQQEQSKREIREDISELRKLIIQRTK